MDRSFLELTNHATDPLGLGNPLREAMWAKFVSQPAAPLLVDDFLHPAYRESISAVVADEGGPLVFDHVAWLTELIFQSLTRIGGVFEKRK